MARVTIEDCLDNQENRFALTLLAAKRARQLMKGATPLVYSPKNKDAVTALREVASGRVALQWQDASDSPCRYHVYRAAAGGKEFARLTGDPIGELTYVDTTAAEGVEYAYVVRAVNRRGVEGEATSPVRAAALSWASTRSGTFSMTGWAMSTSVYGPKPSRWT